MRERNDDSLPIMDGFFNNIQNIDEMELVGIGGNKNKDIALAQIFERTNKTLVLSMFISALLLQIIWVL